MANYKNTGTCIFDYWHNNPPAGFNPLYDPRAKHWQTLAVYDAHRAGVYDLDLSDRADKIGKFYDLRKAAGDINQIELKQAKDYLYNL